MTRSWSFTLAGTGASFNLWTQLINPTIIDPTFSNSPYVPSRVQELTIEVLTPATMLTWGSMQVSAGINNAITMRSSTNSIDLKSQTLIAGTGGMIIAVSIVAL